MDVIDELIACCEAWEPEVCVMGNVRAGEAAKALRGLRADLTMAGAFHKAAVAQRNSAWEEIERLRAELAECQQDAERYRWLRDQCRYGNLTIALCTSFELQPWGGDDTDKAIDTARKGEGE